MEKKRNKYLSVLVMMLLVLPMLWFAGCALSDDSQKSNSNGNIYTVVFYTGISSEFNIPPQEVVDGNLVIKPRNFINVYTDEKTGETKQLVGWYSDPSREQQYLWKFDTDEVHSNMTLYALWQEIDNA